MKRRSYELITFALREDEVDSSSELRYHTDAHVCPPKGIDLDVCWYSGGRLVAHLSDNSAADYVNSYSAAGHYGLVYTLTYRAASDGQQLLVTWTQASGTGTIQLQAAALH